MARLCEPGERLRQKFEDATGALVKLENEYEHSKKDPRYQAIKEDLLTTWRNAGNRFTDHRQKCIVCTNAVSPLGGGARNLA